HHDPNAQRLLAGGAAAVQRLEQREVAPHQEEDQQQHERGQPAARRFSCLPDDCVKNQREHEQGEQHEEKIEQRRRQAGADAGQFKVDVDVLRRFDAMALAEIEVSRGRLHVLILPCDCHARREPTIPENLSTSNLRPMQLGEILDGSFNIFRRHFGLFMRLSIPLLLVTLSKNLLLLLTMFFGVLVVVLLALSAKIIGAIGGLFAFAAGCALFWFIPYIATAYGVTTPVVVLEDLSSSFDAFGR